MRDLEPVKYGRPPSAVMSVERPATFDEVQHFETVQRLLHESFPTVKRGVLQSIRLAASGATIFRSASGRLLVQPDADVLSDDSFFSRSKRRVREPDHQEMARWRLVAVTLETGAPSMRGTKLVELQTRYCTLRIGPDGALNAIVEAEPTALPQIEIDIPVPIHEDMIDVTLAEYRAEQEEAALSPFVAVREEPTVEWRAPPMRRVLRRPSDMPNAQRVTRGSKARCPMPHCKRSLPGNQSIPVATMRGGKLVDLAGKHVQKGLMGVQLEIVMPPRSFVGSADVMGIERDVGRAPEVPPSPARLDAAELRARIAARGARPEALIEEPSVG